jgi:hypothetical protein
MKGELGASPTKIFPFALGGQPVTIGVKIAVNGITGTTKVIGRISGCVFTAVRIIAWGEVILNR